MLDINVEFFVFSKICDCKFVIDIVFEVMCIEFKYIYM